MLHDMVDINIFCPTFMFCSIVRGILSQIEKKRARELDMPDPQALAAGSTAQPSSNPGTPHPLSTCCTTATFKDIIVTCCLPLSSCAAGMHVAISHSGSNANFICDNICELLPIHCGQTLRIQCAGGSFLACTNIGGVSSLLGQ